MARSYVGSCLGSPAITVDGTVTVSFNPSQAFRLRGVQISAIDVLAGPAWLLWLLRATRWLRVPWRARVGDGLHLWTWYCVSRGLFEWLHTRAQKHALRQVFVTDVTTQGDSLWATTGMALPAALLVDWRTSTLDLGAVPEARIDVVLSGNSFGESLLVCLMGVVPDAEYLDDEDELVELIGAPPGEQKRVNRETH